MWQCFGCGCKDNWSTRAKCYGCGKVVIAKEIQLQQRNQRRKWNNWHSGSNNWKQEPPAWLLEKPQADCKAKEQPKEPREEEDVFQEEEEEEEVKGLPWEQVKLLERTIKGLTGGKTQGLAELLAVYVKENTPLPTLEDKEKKMKGLEHKFQVKKAALKTATAWEEDLRTKAELAKHNLDKLSAEVQEMELTITNLMKEITEERLDHQAKGTSTLGEWLKVGKKGSTKTGATKKGKANQQEEQESEEEEETPMRDKNKKKDLARAEGKNAEENKEPDEGLETTENQAKGEDKKGSQARKAQLKQGDKKGSRENSRSPRLHKDEMET